MLRHTLTCLALAGIAFAAVAAAQSAPSYVPVQGSLFADDGTPEDGALSLTFRLYEQSVADIAFYAEVQLVQVDNGFFTAYLGDGTLANLGDGSTSPALELGTFVNRPQGIVFLGVQVGDEAELLPRLQLGSVPYSAFAQSCGDAGSLGGMAVADFQPKITGGCPAEHCRAGGGWAQRGRLAHLRRACGAAGSKR